MLAALVVLVATLVALAFRPIATLRAHALRGAWIGVLLVVALAWSTPRLLPGGLALQFSLACLLVLMFGWPLAIIMQLPIALGAAWLAGAGMPDAIELAAWRGVLPATLGLAAGLAIRRWLPEQVFVYILGRGFAATVLATFAAQLFAARAAPLPSGTTFGSLVVATFLVAWGEAVITGMLVAIFVAYRPAWLVTWSDRRHLGSR